MPSRFLKTFASSVSLIAISGSASE